MNGGDLVALEVELTEMGKATELKSMEGLQAVVLQVKGSESLQTIKGLVLNLLNVGAIEMNGAQILAANKSVTPENVQPVAI